MEKKNKKWISYTAENEFSLSGVQQYIEILEAWKKKKSV